MTDYQRMFERALADEPVHLSGEGRARREALRDALSSSVIVRRRRRAAVRWGGGALIVLTLSLLGWRLGMRAPVEAPPQMASLEHAHFTVVHDDVGMLERCRARQTPLPAEVWISDSELLVLLRSDNRVTGLIRTPGRVVLTRDVVDPISE